MKFLVNNVFYVFKFNGLPTTCIFHLIKQHYLWIGDDSVSKRFGNNNVKMVTENSNSNSFQLKRIDNNANCELSWNKYTKTMISFFHKVKFMISQESQHQK